MTHMNIFIKIINSRDEIILLQNQIKSNQIFNKINYYAYVYYKLVYQPNIVIIVI